jgi:hypothetical protein
MTGAASKPNAPPVIDIDIDKEKHMFVAAIVCGAVAGLLGSILGRHAGTLWASLFGVTWIAGVLYSEVIADKISLGVAGAALVSFGSAKVLHDVTGFLERREARSTST